MSNGRSIAVGLSLVAVLSACADDQGGTSTAGTTTTATTTATVEPVIDPGDAGRYRPDIDPGEFVDGIDHPYLPLVPGARWVYEGESEGEIERIEVEVLTDRRQVFGIAATVVRDRVLVDGELVEDTFDWFAQDEAGNVWYLGEETAEYEDGEIVSTEGAWEAGVDRALPGIVMPADLRPGAAYRQEFLPGEAEDMAEVLRLDGTATVPFGTFGDVVTIREWTPLDPGVVEEKHYAPGVGMIYESTVTGDGERIELIDYVPG